MSSRHPRTRIRAVRASAGGSGTLVARGLTALVAVFLAAPGADAQNAHSTSAVDSIRRIQQIEPTHGPVGTRVHLSTLNLPVQAKVHIGYGATRTGFEALFEVPQGMWGDIETELTIPPTVPWDRAIVFVAFNAIFSPIGLSDPFHVVNAEGLLRRTGTITDEADGCPTLRDQDGYLYALGGDLGDFGPGDQVTIDGTYAPTGSCLDESTIGVTRIVPVG
jgi:hypothetical protein